MNDLLKQRLVGALILVALGVVFWPIIFVEPGERAAVNYGPVPAAPEIDSTPIPPPDAGGLQGSPEWQPEERGLDQAVDEAAETPVIVDEEADAAAPVAAEPAAAEETPVPPPRTRTDAPQSPVLDSRGVPVAWILQVASVSSAAKAEQLRDRLLALEKKAYVKKLDQGGRELYRVYVGPNFERAQLEKIQATVDQQFGVHSMIVRYVP